MCCGIIIPGLENWFPYAPAVIGTAPIPLWPGQAPTDPVDDVIPVDTEVPLTVGFWAAKAASGIDFLLASCASDGRDAARVDTAES